MEIKRELHDNVKPLLTLSNMNMEGLLPMLTKAQQEKLLPAIEGNEKAMEHVDDLSLAINSDWLKGLGLVNALNREIEKLRRADFYEIETVISEHQVAMDRDRELLIFRIVQEAISNIIKHALATKILFSVQYEQDHAVFIITDNGKGIDLAAQANKNTRMGMNNMQSRAQLLQAQFKIETAPGKGTSINLAVPYNTQHN
jgi:signal transduction histidine kinase